MWQAAQTSGWRCCSSYGLDATCSLLAAMELSGSRDRRERCCMADFGLNALAALQILKWLHLKHRQLG